jgi:hypothetical protein
MLNLDFPQFGQTARNKLILCLASDALQVGDG